MQQFRLGPCCSCGHFRALLHVVVAANSERMVGRAVATQASAAFAASQGATAQRAEVGLFPGWLEDHVVDRIAGKRFGYRAVHRLLSRWRAEAAADASVMMRLRRL